MNADRFTVKSQEALQAALSLAARNRNPQALPEHLLSALLEQEGGIVTPVLRNAGVDDVAVRQANNGAIGAMPTLAEGGEASQPASELIQALQRAEALMAEMNDEYVSTEHMLLALAAQDGAAGDALRAAGATPDVLKEAIAKVRGPHRVTDQNAEDQYQALEKYGVDLTARAAEANSTRLSAATMRFDA